MIICLELSQRTKDQLDKLLNSGYRDYSEAVAVAIANQTLLHDRSSEGAVASPVVLASKPATGHEQIRSTGQQSLEPLDIPALFSELPTDVKVPAFAPYPEDEPTGDVEIPVDRWIFGQHNKLLPAKATTRALARLMTSDGKGNLTLARTASEIASAAVKLGDYLRRVDAASGVHRDDALSFAFPYSGSTNGDKSRLRYANQFVASVSKQGALAGLPFELKLVNLDTSRTPQILLTEAGWQFAQMRNPVLDEKRDGRQAKFSDQEIEFLLAHIATRVPVEAFAHKLIADAIMQGANTPEKLDDALAEYLPNRKYKPFTRAFLMTQRAGVLSRMIDLGLVQRKRDGINVTYAVTPKTFESSPNPVRQAI